MSIGKSLFSQIFFSQAVVILLFTTLSLVLSLGVIRTYFFNQEAAELKNSALVTVANIKSLVLSKNFRSTTPIIEKIAKKIGVRITLIDSNGIVIADSRNNKILINNLREKPEVNSALNGKIGKQVRYSLTFKERLFYVAIPIKKRGKIVGVLRVSRPLKLIRMVIDDFEAKIVQITLVVLSFSLLLSFVFSKDIAFDLKRLAVGAKRIASGRFDTRIKTKNRGEIKILVDSFNNMADQIKRLFGDVAKVNNELSAIIRTIPDAIAVLKDGKIEIANSSFCKLARDNDVIGKRYWELTGGRDIGSAIEDVISDKRSSELKIDEKFYNYAAARLPGKKIMIILHDITSIKTLEQIKNDFVANVSHELRTPLAAIKGFTETLIEEEKNLEKLHYLEIIDKHADRLTNIVADLLTLSQLEDKTVSLSVEPIDIKNEIESILKLFENRSKEKNISLEMSVNDNLPVIYLDSYKFDQLMINLIDNAIKYTEHGKVSISAEMEVEDKLRVIVEDTGIGIPDNEKERIFERFYRVDKSRSKAARGTGLGLSIVKHIVLLFGGTIEVESKPGIGSKFIITLPI